MFHQLYNSQYTLFDLENYFFNCYFASIIYYAGSKLIKQMYSEKPLPLRILRISYGSLMVVHLALFIVSATSDTTKCLDFWYLTVRMIGFAMALFFCGIGRIYQIRAQRRLRKIQEQSGAVSQIHNPLPRIWCWVLFNLFGQSANIIKSFVFVLDGSLDCKYDKNNGNINYIVSLVMEIITFYLPLVSSIYMFWIEMKGGQRRRETQEQVSLDRSVGIEMTVMTSPMARAQSF